MARLDAKKPASTLRPAKINAHNDQPGHNQDTRNGDDTDRDSSSMDRRDDRHVFVPSTAPALEKESSSPVVNAAKNGKRQFPKEKWVSSPTSGTNFQNASFESMDDYLKDCTHFGKYQVDRHSLVDQKLVNSAKDSPAINNRNTITDRYGGAALDLIRKTSSEDDIAAWRSDDEEDYYDEDPWDEAIEDPVMLSKTIKPRTHPDDNSNEESATSLQSHEMGYYNPKGVQILTNEQRFIPQTEISFRNHEIAPVKKKKSWGLKISTKNRHHISRDHSGLTRTEGPVPSHGRTMSSISNSNSENDEDEGTHELEQSKTRKHVNHHFVNLPKGMSGSLLDEEIDDDDEDIESKDEVDDLSRCSNSSGSLSYSEQRKYRKARRAEHRRRIWRRRLQHLERFVPRLLGQENENERGNRKNRNNDMILQRDNETDLSNTDAACSASTYSKTKMPMFGVPTEKHSPPKHKTRFLRFRRGNQADLLPWEKPGKMSWFRKERRSVDDLPFPTYHSFDGSLLEACDRYRDILEDLKAISPDWDQSSQERRDRVAR